MRAEDKLSEVMKSNMELINEEIRLQEEIIENIKQMISKEGQFVQIGDGEIIDLKDNIRWRTEWMIEVIKLRGIYEDCSFDIS
jgi:hypothetical protein